MNEWLGSAEYRDETWYVNLFVLQDRTVDKITIPFNKQTLLHDIYYEFLQMNNNAREPCYVYRVILHVVQNAICDYIGPL